MAKSKRAARTQRRKRGDTTHLPRAVYPLMRFSRTTTPAAIVKVNVDVGSARIFRLSDVPGNSDITSFFQFYRIDSVDVHYNFITPNISGSTPFPRIYTALDNGTGTTPTSFDTVTSYTSCKQYQLGTSRVQYTRRLSPVPLLTTAGNTGVVAMDPWINCNSPGVPHYGLLEWLAPYNTVSNNAMVVEYSVTYHFSCKGAR